MDNDSAMAIGGAAQATPSRHWLNNTNATWIKVRIPSEPAATPSRKSQT
jgi:hypothetical protein